MLLISIVVDYSSALLIENKPDRKKLWLTLSLLTNFGILGFYKYFNFFIDSANFFLSQIGFNAFHTTLEIILPLGISFYTFQTVSYSVDVYRGKFKATRNFLDFALYVSFFPQLVAGPIERAKNLLPQISNPRVINMQHIQLGCWLILWGLFKKIAIADQLAPYSFWGVNKLQAVGLDMWLASVAFCIRFYCDFSGYSDMAIGLASLLGIKLSLNFNLPYLASNPAELWQRWHITLTQWFRDYVYGPIKKQFKSKLATPVATILTMSLVGLWHGADVKFLVWGFAWGVALVIYSGYARSLKAKNPLAKFKFIFHPLSIISTFIFWTLINSLFVAESFADSFQIQKSLLTDFRITERSLKDFYSIVYISMPLFVIQALQYKSKDLNRVLTLPFIFRFSIIFILFILLIGNGVANENEFIYFQF